MRLNVLILFIIIFKIDMVVLADEKPKFPHEIYYVDPHPKAKFNVLKNGFRYILMPNFNQNGKIFVSLLVNAGAIHEIEGQQGVAHFVEHMAFNGTKNHPSESLSKFLSNMGMSLDEDANAKTGLYHTEYLLSLQTSDSLNEGLSILSDFAMNITFDTTEIEKEKGVVLSEKRYRNSLFDSVSNRQNQFVLPNISFAQNAVIGSESAIQGITQEACLDYYKNNYRPKNMVLIVVGDFNIKNCEKAILEKFEGCTDKSNRVSLPSQIEVKHEGTKVNYVYEAGLPIVNIKIGTAQKIAPPGKSFFENSKIELAELAAEYIMQKRLVGNVLQKDCPLNSFYFKNENFGEQFNVTSIEANCEADKWEAALNLLSCELNKAIRFGFLDSEVESFKDWYRNKLKTDLDEKGSLQNNELMSQILNSLKENKPFADNKQSYKLSKVLLECLSKDAVHNEFKKYWVCDHRLIDICGNVLIKEPNVEIKKVYESAIIVKDEEVKKESSFKFPYDIKPKEPWSISKSQDISDHFFSRYFYKNNVIVNYKFSNFKSNQVFFNINVGLGDAALPEGKEALSRIASHAINFGGLEKLSFLELKNYLVDKNVNVFFYVGANCFTFECETTTKDFELALQVCRAMLLSPGFRPEAEEVLNKTINQKYAKIELDLFTHFNNSLSGILARGSPVLFWPDRKIISEVNLDDAKKWLQEQFKDGAIEINVLGDKGYQDVRELVGLYFGGLPTRKSIQPRKLRDFGITQNFNVVEKIPSKLDKSLVTWIFPTVDYRQIYEVHKLDLLQVILQEKINKLVREKLSLSYNPEATHIVKDNYKNSCYLKFFADTNAEGVEAVQKAFESTIKELLDTGITYEELVMAKKVAVNHTASFVNSKQFLFDFVFSFSSAEPENIVMLKSYLNCYENITQTQIQESIKTYLKLEKKSVYILQGVVE